MKRIGLMLLLLMPMFVHAKPAELTLTLRDAILLALRYNPTVQTAEIQRVVDKYSLEVANYAFEWQYALNASAQYSDTRASGARSDSQSYSVTPSAKITTAIGTQVTATMGNNTSNRGSQYNPGASLNVTQPLLRGFGRDVTLRPLYDAYDNQIVNRLNLKKTVISTITTVISQYISLLQAQYSLQSQERTLQEALRQLQQGRLKVKAGKMAAADLIEPEACIANQRLQLSQAKNALEQSRLTLLNTIGLDPSVRIIIKQEVQLPNEEIPKLPIAQKLILQNDINYQMALIQRRIDERALLFAKDNLRAQLNLIAQGTMGGGTSGGRNAGFASLANNDNRTSSVKLEFSIPIDNKPLQQAFLQAKVTLQKDDINLRQQRWMLETTIMNALRDLEAKRQQVMLAEQASHLAARSLDIAEKKLRLGLGTTFETTTLRNKLLAVEVQTINARMW